MRAWLRHHGASAGATLVRLGRAPFATFLNLLAIGVAIALPLAAYVAISNAERLSRNLAGEPQLSVYFTADAARPDFDRVEAELRRADAVKRLAFVSKDEALAQLKRTEGLGDAIGALKSNPLPDAFIVYLARDVGERAERLAAELARQPKVAHVQVDGAWVKRLEALLRTGRLAVGLLSGLLGLALVAITFNTIRLQIMTHLDEIELAQLVGATDAYVRRPFYYLGAMLGVGGGLVALGLVAGGVAALNREVDTLSALYGSSYRLMLPSTGDLAAITGFAIVLGLAGAWLATSMHLRR